MCEHTHTLQQIGKVKNHTIKQNSLSFYRMKTVCTSFATVMNYKEKRREALKFLPLNNK